MSEPGRRVVASWLWYVVNPQIEHCAYEDELLSRTLTFRQHDGKFERLKPLRQALSPDGRQIFDDICEDLPDYKAIVKDHDDGLAALQQRAVELFNFCLANDTFQAAFNASATAIGEADRRILKQRIAEHVVNGIHELGSEYDTADLWNHNRDRFIAAVEPQWRVFRYDVVEPFKHAVRATIGRLRSQRKEWSRKFDIPVAPTPGLTLEALAD